MSHEWKCQVFKAAQPKSEAETDQLKKSEWAATATVTCAGNGRLYTAERNQLAQQVADYIGSAVLMVD